jgi:S2P endopeptidase
MLTPTPAVVLCLLWAVIHALTYLLRLSRSRSLLPVAFPRSRYSSIVWRSSSTKLTLKKLHLRLETTAWNLKHDSLANLLVKRKSWARCLTYFYNVGTVLAVLGMAGSLGILLFTCSPLLEIFSLGKLPDEAHHPPSRRSLEASSFNASQDRVFTDTHFLTPIIPGVTVPITHLPMILFVVFIGQVIHEAGHAISAAL